MEDLKVVKITQQNPKKPNGYFTKAKKADNDNEYDNDILDDDYIDINYVCMSDEELQKMPQSFQEQIELYKLTIKQLNQEKRKDILEKLDINILSKCWERVNKYSGIEDIKSYFKQAIINEVEKC